MQGLLQPVYQARVMEAREVEAFDNFYARLAYTTGKECSPPVPSAINFLPATHKKDAAAWPCADRLALKVANLTWQ
eukprot:1161301-Pelagomonas_calceolata.AAC.4